MIDNFFQDSITQGHPMYTPRFGIKKGELTVFVKNTNRSGVRERKYYTNDRYFSKIVSPKKE